jgi:hypothetical protein
LLVEQDDGSADLVFMPCNGKTMISDDESGNIGDRVESAQSNDGS